MIGRRLGSLDGGFSAKIVLWVLLGVWAIVMLVPLLLMVPYSFTTQDGLHTSWVPSLDGWASAFAYGRGVSLLTTFKISVISTAILLVIAVPTAFWLAKVVQNAVVKVACLALIAVPFFLSEDARTIIWTTVYNRNGLVNTALQGMGIIDTPIDGLLYSEFSIYLGLIPIYFASMFFPIWFSMSLIDDQYVNAARDLGASWRRVMFEVILPLAVPGILAGLLFTLIPMLGDTIVPSMLGGGQIVLLSDTLQTLVAAFNYAGAAATSVVVAVILLLGLGVMFRSKLVSSSLQELQR